MPIKRDCGGDAGAIVPAARVGCAVVSFSAVVVVVEEEIERAIVLVGFYSEIKKKEKKRRLPHPEWRPSRVGRCIKRTRDGNPLMREKSMANVLWAKIQSKNPKKKKKTEVKAT